jgi:hypothetical protein
MNTVTVSEKIIASVLEGVELKIEVLFFGTDAGIADLHGGLRSTKRHRAS